MNRNSHLLRKIAVNIFYQLKIYKLMRDSIKILMYHRFRADGDSGYITKKSEFEEHIKFLTKNFSVVNLDNILVNQKSRRFKKNEKILAITIDDGYMNCYRYAYPILKKKSIPATIFTPFNFIDKGNWLWQDKNIFILRSTQTKQSIFKFDNNIIEVTTSPLNKLFESLYKVYNFCAPLSEKKKEEFSEKLAMHFKVEFPEKPVDEFEPLKWWQIKEMEKNGITIGSHTMNHLILTETGN